MNNSMHHSPQPGIPAENPVPFNLWATHTNRWFYNGLRDPLRAFRTLGSADPLLPAAYASTIRQEALDNNVSIHEIGSGNFFFAKQALKHGLIMPYTGYDFADRSGLAKEQHLPENFHFQHIPANEVRSRISGAGARIVGVELCDDLPNEFWTCHQGQTYEMWIDIEVDAAWKGYKGQSFSFAELLFSVDGKLAGLDHDLDASGLAQVIAEARWNELNDYDPGFLKALSYRMHQFMPFDIDRIWQTGFSGMPEDFRQTGEIILSEYLKQLEQITEFGSVVHLPVAAIKLLWQFRDLPDIKVQFFDYGYDSIANLSAAFMNFQGQLTTPVNFGILKIAAELMGYEVCLEKDREFINKSLGCDTLIIGRIMDLGLKTQAELMEHFAGAAATLCPDAEVSEWTISSLRVLRSDADRIASKLGRSYRYKDGSFHFCAIKN